MKKLFLLILSLLCVVTISKAQNILVANNNPGAAMGTGPSANIYTGTNALENAVSAAVNGDIVYVVPSSIPYVSGDLNINTGITIFGVGINPDKDLGTSSFIDTNCFNCEVNIQSDNVRLSGLVFNGEIRLGGANSNITYTDIIIENSTMTRILMQPGNNVQIDNLLIRNNIMDGEGSIATHILLTSLTSNVVITNNVMVEGNIGSQQMMQATGAIFSYNVFADTGTEGPFSAVTNCTFDHNIFYGVAVNVNPASSPGNTWNYNLSYMSTGDAFLVDGTGGNTGTGNIESMDPLFTDFPLVQEWDHGYDLTLQAGSPALSTDPLNLSSEDIGPSGGATPLNQEGNLLPLIQSITVPAVIPVGSDLPVNVKAKGN